jgi:CO/xanthine dehydrogenase Mo-binding subunit
VTTPHTGPRSGLPNSLLDNPLLGTWIGFEETGRVRLATGKVEIGQGVLTALAQIAAEELDVSPARLRIVSGETPTSPREGFTSGQQFDCRIGQLHSPGLRRGAGALSSLRRGSPRVPHWSSDHRRRPLPARRPSYRSGLLVDRRRDRPCALRDRRCGSKSPSSYRIVGQSVPRLDLAAKLAGSAFIHDLAPENLLHARMLRRPWSGARLADFDEAAVRRAAGAPIDIVRAGDLVAFTSDDEVAAMRAAQTARGLAAWAGGAKPSSDAGEPNWLRDQRTRDRIVETGAAAGVAGNRVVEASFSRPFLAYGSIGPSCALAEFKDGKLTVWTHSQGVFELRRWLAHALGIDPTHVTVLHRRAPAATATTRPTTSRSMPPSSQCARRTARCVCNGRVRMSSQPRPWDRPWSWACARCSMPMRARPIGRSRSGARSTPSVRA